jgi:hypothetical protein
VVSRDIHTLYTLLQPLQGNEAGLRTEGTIPCHVNPSSVSLIASFKHPAARELRKAQSMLVNARRASGLQSG